MQYNFFTTRIWKFNSGNMFTGLADFAVELKSTDKGRTVSNVLGWQSSTNLLNSSTTKKLIQYVQTMVTEPIVQYGIDTLNITIEVTDLWANINSKGAFNMPHEHAGNNNFFSFVYYAQVDKDNGNIAFKSPNPANKFFNLPKKEDTELNSTDVIIDVAQGDLIIFPSWLEHYTYPNKSSDRICFAGNVKISEQ